MYTGDKGMETRKPEIVENRDTRCIDIGIQGNRDTGIYVHIQIIFI